jgi:predicted MPP superfamily phosphohydrolase
MLGGLMAFTNSVHPLGHIAYMTASLMMGFTLYLIMAVLFVDGIHLLVKLKPVFYGLTAIVIAAVVFAYGVWHAYNPKTVMVEVPVKGISREHRALHLSDIHLGHFRGKDYLRKIVGTIKDLDIDAVFLTGDLFDGKIQLSMEVISPFKQLDVPIYFVEGNHDGYTDSVRVKQELRESGIRVLENEVTKWEEFQLIGLDYMPADRQSYDMHALEDHKTIKEMLPALKIDREQPSILLHHSPVGVNYASENGIDLYLAGHTHGGQLFPVNLIAKLMFPYNRGLYRVNGTSVYVSQGTGTFGPPLRVGTRSEMAVIIMKPEMH